MPNVFHNRLDEYFRRMAKKSAKPAHFQLLVHSDKLNIHYAYSTNGIDQPFHIASVGKTFTAVLLAMLEEQGKLAFSDPISRYLPGHVLAGLFQYQGRDWQAQVTIEQLVAHTSGINDYFEGKVKQGPPFLKYVLDAADTSWTPEQLVSFTRDNQNAVGAPGLTYRYSDTGYILLGMLIEAVTGKAFHDNLHQYFFQPLGMRDSYLMFYSEPKNKPGKPLEEVWLKGREISTYASLSCDWSGGGIVSTVADLCLFHCALQEGRLISKQRLQEMEAPRHKFRSGMHYGLGMMEIRFEGFFFLLRGLPRLKGHSGVLSTHMYYDPVHDAYITMNMASTGNMVKSFNAIIRIVNALRAVDKAMGSSRKK